MVNKQKTGKKVLIPSKISTDSSLSALTFALFLTDIISSNSKSILVKIFQKDDKDEFILIKEEYYDQSGKFEKLKMFSNNQWTTYYPETIKTLENFSKKGRGVKFYSESEKLLKEIGIQPEKLEGIYKPMFEDALNRASEILFWAIFLERFFNLNNAQSVINFCYTLVRSVDYLSDSKVLIGDFVRLLGKNWRWEIVWNLALNEEKVKRFWEGKQDRGEAFLRDWKKECQRLATNCWLGRKHHIKGIKEASLEMRNRLKIKFDSR